MRRVACYSVASVITASESPLDALHSLVAIVDAWLQTKGLHALPEGAAKFKLTDGREATVSVTQSTLRQDSVWEVTLTEPTDSGWFLTRVCLGTRFGRIYLFLELRAGGDGALVAPVETDVRGPLVLRQLLQCRAWSAGHTPARTQPIDWRGADAARRFLAVVRHKDRNLPVVAVSQHFGQLLVPTLADDLARELCGLAVVARLDEAASWEVTNTAGKEWSCFNGAVRLYWPLRGTSGSAFDHPVWTRARLLESAGTEQAAAGRIRHQLRRRLLEVSTYTFDEPVELQQVRDEAARARFDALVGEASEKGNQADLAEHYFNESARLERELGRERERADRLQEQVANLSQALQYLPTSPGSADEIAPEPAFTVNSIQDAVLRATEEFPQDLVFGGDVSEGITTVVANAGPPDKIFEYLKTLAEMAQQRRSDGLGKDMIAWLKEHGLKASAESQTVLNSAAEMQKRTWDDGRGTRRRFEKHLKPKDGTSPDQCVRIYFDYDEAIEKAVVGWVGRHP